MTDLATPVAFALLCWWFGTGAILWLVRRDPRSFFTSMIVCTLLLGLSFWATWESMQAATERNAYLGFASVILMWSWHEMAFLTGWLTGPRARALQPGVTGFTRFTQSLCAVLWHELALLANFGVLLLMQQGQPSHVAICTFALLWCMRASAKLNLFFGVPEVGAQYLPRHLTWLATHFRTGSLSGFFYLSVGLACAVWAWMVWELASGQATVTTGWLLLAALLGLAIVEHLLMVFALPMQKLWGWAMAQRHPPRPNPTALSPTTVVVPPVNVDRA